MRFIGILVLSLLTVPAMAGDHPSSVGIHKKRISFGFTRRREPAVRKLTLTNTTSQSLTDFMVEVSGQGFSGIDNCPDEFGPGESCEIEMTFFTGQYRPANRGTLMIQFNNGESETVTLWAYMAKGGRGLL